MFLKISKKAQENPCVGAPFNKVAGWSKMELSAEINNGKKRNFAKFCIRAPGDFLDMWLVLSQWDIRKWFATKYLHFTKMKSLLK